ncbi:cell division protein ZapA [Phenylobacterium sp.]|uniref:cell division protein ZapA n=1 Tax=Phenylobacterium sp. TaxID=1871053 RepID=UPI00180CEA93|nr:cell division protein ZapA [Phenylobacterium sp.]MBA4793173.1 cell division protein ZapA [Phenylobacterium sp.]MBC7166974.1 cell division protein ZapA [Phenylobacterium sp.]
MAQLTIDVNGRPYQVGCEDGQEPHLLELARLFDRQVRAVSQDMGQLSETRLFLMAALLLADELWDSRSRMASVQAELARLQSDHARIEAKAVAALDAAAKRIEKLAAE